MEFFDFFCPKIKIAEMFTMVPNKFQDPNWVCETIQFVVNRQFTGLQLAPISLTQAYHEHL